MRWSMMLCAKYLSCDRLTLYYSTTSPTDKLAGKAAFPIGKLAGNQFYRPILSVTVSPVGKGLSRPTYIYRPTVWQYWTTFTDRHICSWPTFFFPTNIMFPTNILTRYILPTDFLKDKAFLSRPRVLRCVFFQLANQLTIPTYSRFT
jgi:hypothetical protein